MPPLFVPPLVKIALGTLGAAAMLHWLVKEMRRLNAQFDQVQPAAAFDPAARAALPTLRRDPRTGEWRVM
jgi:hypothetical protein